MRIGFGYDVHKLVEGRKLILGGVTIPFNKGLTGHSDADVAIHAIIDALLGAAALGDIGAHFPDTDPQYKNISSLVLLAEVVRMMNSKNFRIVNVDATVVCEAPGLAPFIPQMKESLLRVLGLECAINIKATRGEGLGFIGRGEGIVCLATVLVEEQ